MEILSPHNAGLEISGLAFSLFAVFIAAIIRGYVGFGFSALVVASVSLWLPPTQVVPLVLLLEIAASLHMLPLVWRQVNWRILAWLSLGMLIATPLGMSLLAKLPDAPMRVTISLLVLIVSILILRGYSLRKAPSNGMVLCAGLVSGAMNGAAALGGLPIVVFLLSSAVEAAVIRATLVVVFMGADIYASVIASAHGLLDAKTLWWAGYCLLPLYLGVALGHKIFLWAKPEWFRRFALILLMGLSILGLIRVVISG